MSTPSKSEIDRLRKAVFADAENSDEGDYPSTAAEKVDYAEFVAIKSLERLSRAIRRLSRFNRLCVAGRGDLPKIIMYNEARVAYERLRYVKRDIDEAVDMIAQVMDENRGAEAQKFAPAAADAGGDGREPVDGGWHR